MNSPLLFFFVSRIQFTSSTWSRDRRALLATANYAREMKAPHDVDEDGWIHAQKKNTHQ